MTAEQPKEQVLSRIAFTERWLARARSQVVSGNLPRGILTLVLAGAEVRHALEVAGAGPAPPRRRLALLVPAALGLVVLAALAAVTVARHPGDETALAGGPAPRIVTFSARTGELLNLIPLPVSSAALTPASQPPAAATAPVRKVVRSRSRAPSPAVAALQPAPAVRATGPGQPGAGSATPLAPTPAAAAPSPAPQRSAAQAGPASGANLTLGDLIDLVLAAERTLRGDAAGR